VPRENSRNAPTRRSRLTAVTLKPPALLRSPTRPHGPEHEPLRQQSQPTNARPAPIHSFKKRRAHSTSAPRKRPQMRFDKRFALFSPIAKRFTAPPSTAAQNSTRLPFDSVSSSVRSPAPRSACAVRRTPNVGRSRRIQFRATPRPDSAPQSISRRSGFQPS